MNQLRDIQLPPPISWWPIAPGWWLLAIGTLALMIYGIIFWRRRWRYYLPSKVALARVKNLEKLAENSQDAQRVLSELTTLVRRVCLAYFPRQQVAELTGIHWLNFLNQTTQKSLFASCGNLLIDVAYQREVKTDVRPAIHAVAQWLVTMPVEQRRGRHV